MRNRLMKSKTPNLFFLPDGWTKKSKAMCPSVCFSKLGALLEMTFMKHRALNHLLVHKDRAHF